MGHHAKLNKTCEEKVRVMIIPRSTIVQEIDSET